MPRLASGAAAHGCRDSLDVLATRKADRSAHRTDYASPLYSHWFSSASTHTKHTSPSLQFSPKSPHTARSRPRHPVHRTAPIGASQHQATARSRGRAVLWGGSTTETKKKQMRQVMVCVWRQPRPPSSTVAILTSACIDPSRSPTTARKFLVLAVGIEQTLR